MQLMNFDETESVGTCDGAHKTNKCINVNKLGKYLRLFHVNDVNMK